MLRDCYAKDLANAEIFLVQSGPPAEAALRMRERSNQAVQPVGSNICKVKNRRVDVVLDDEHIMSIIASLGSGVSLNGSYDSDSLFNLAKLRYHKIILVSEPTAEGRHIRDQIVTFMHRFNAPLLEKGYVYRVPADLWSEMSDEEFASKVMTPDTRNVVRIEPSERIEQVLSQLKLIDST